MKGYGSQWATNTAQAFTEIQIASRPLWTMRKVQDPIVAAAWSATRSPRVRSSWCSTLTGCLWSDSSALWRRSLCLDSLWSTRADNSRHSREASSPLSTHIRKMIRFALLFRRDAGSTDGLAGGLMAGLFVIFAGIGLYEAG